MAMVTCSRSENLSWARVRVSMRTDCVGGVKSGRSLGN